MSIDIDTSAIWYGWMILGALVVGLALGIVIGLSTHYLLAHYWLW